MVILEKKKHSVNLLLEKGNPPALEKKYGL